jgi:hypothetical protein
LFTEELEVITADLWLDSPGYLAVLVTFYPNKPTADLSAEGFALENEQAARVVLAQFLSQGTSVEDEVREAMANGGIYIVVPADETRELTQESAVGRLGEAPARFVAPTAFKWVKAAWRALVPGSGSYQTIRFVNFGKVGRIRLSYRRQRTKLS